MDCGKKLVVAMLLVFEIVDILRSYIDTPVGLLFSDSVDLNTVVNGRLIDDFYDYMRPIFESFHEIQLPTLPLPKPTLAEDDRLKLLKTYKNRADPLQLNDLNLYLSKINDIKDHLLLVLHYVKNKVPVDYEIRALNKYVKEGMICLNLQNATDTCQFVRVGSTVTKILPKHGGSLKVELDQGEISNAKTFIKSRSCEGDADLDLEWENNVFQYMKPVNLKFFKNYKNVEKVEVPTPSMTTRPYKFRKLEPFETKKKGFLFDPKVMENLPSSSKLPKKRQIKVGEEDLKTQQQQSNSTQEQIQIHPESSKPEVDKTSDESAPTLFEQINLPICPVTEKPPNKEQVKKLMQKNRKEPTIDEPPNAEAETVTKEDVTLRQKNDSIMGVPTAVHLPVTGSTPPPAVAPTPAPQLPPTSTTTSSIPAAQIPQQQSPASPVVVPVQQQQVPIQESKEQVSGNQPDDVSDQKYEMKSTTNEFVSASTRKMPLKRKVSEEYGNYENKKKYKIDQPKNDLDVSNTATGSTPHPAVAPTPAPQLLPTSTTTSSIPAAQVPQQQSPASPVVIPVQQQVPIQESKEQVSGNQPDDSSNQAVEEVATFYSFEMWEQKEIESAAKTPVSTPPCENVPKKIEVSPKKVETPKKQDTSDDDLPKSE